MVIWHPEAQEAFREAYLWYKTNMGRNAAQCFADNVLACEEYLDKHKYIGMIDLHFSNEQAEYRTFTIHANYRFIYRINPTNGNIYIA